MSSDQQFWLAVLGQVVAALGIVATYLKTRETNRRVEGLQVSVDGRLSQLLSEKDARLASAEKEAAHSSGIAEGAIKAAATATAGAPTSESRPFGRRANDQPLSPVTPIPVTVVQPDDEPVIVRESEVPPDRLPRAGSSYRTPPPYRPPADVDPSTHQG